MMAVGDNLILFVDVVVTTLDLDALTLLARLCLVPSLDATAVDDVISQ